METSSILYGLLILLACISPFIITAQLKSIKTNKEIKEFKNYGFKYGIELNDVDKWPNHLIGVDSLKKKLLYIEKYDGQHEEILLDLSEFKKCEVAKKDNVTGEGNSIDKIQLSFQSKISNSTTLLNFYNSEKNSAMYFEFNLSKKWCDLVNALIQGKQPEQSGTTKSKELKLNLA